MKYLTYFRSIDGSQVYGESFNDYSQCIIYLDAMEKQYPGRKYYIDWRHYFIGE